MAMTIEQWEYVGMTTLGLLLSLLAYRFPRLAHTPNQIKTFRWSGPLLVVCGGLLFLATLRR